MRLHWKLMLTYTSVVVLVMAFFHLYLDRVMRDFLVGHIGDSLAREVRLSGAYLRRDLPEPPDADALDGLADVIGERLGVRATVIDGAGRVLGDSQVPTADVGDLENHADRPEIQAAWGGRVGRSVRFSETLRQEMLYVAAVIPGVGDGRTVMRLSRPLQDVQRTQGRIRRGIWSALALGLVLALLLTYGASRFVTRPIREMTGMANAMASGNFDAHADTPGISATELRDLTLALNEMRRQTQDRIGQITAEKSRLEGVVTSIAEGILVTEADGRVRMTNRTFDRWFGVSSPSSGRMPVELVRNAEVQDAIERTLDTGEQTALEIGLSGRLERYLDVHVAPILQDGASIGSVTVFYDISELRRLERVRRDFVANVSHELRTPLTAIKGCAATLIDGALSDACAAARFVQTINTHADRLQLLLDDLLDLSRLESGKLQVKPVTLPVSRLAAGALNTVKQAAAERDILLDVDILEDVEVRCDPELIEQALINLLDNAIKYTSNGGSVHVRTRRLAAGETAAERSGRETVPAASPEPDGGLLLARRTSGAQQRDAAECVAVEVVDTGIGIPSEDLHRVFERFYRVDKGRSRALGGTGLGLSIVRHIVEAHGEQVYVKSELGKGSTFGFTVQIASENRGERLDSNDL